MNKANKMKTKKACPQKVIRHQSSVMSRKASVISRFLHSPYTFIPYSLSLFFTLNFSLFTSNSFSQDIHFSQFWMSPLLQNPALVGANYDMQAIINYKDQWRSVASPYKTYNLSYDMKLNKKKVKKGFWAGGINFFNDKAGDAQMGTTQGNLSFAYHVLLNPNNTLGAALMGGFGQRSINFSALQWGSQYDGTSYNSALPNQESSGASSIMYPEIGTGVLWAYNKGASTMSSNDMVIINAGIAAFNVNQPKYSFYHSGENLNMKIVVHANLLYGIKNTNLSIAPGFIFYNQGSSKETLFGTMFRYTLKDASKVTGYIKGSAISFGVHYRNKDAVILSGLLEMGSYAFGLSYDVNVSGLKSASTGRGGLEISLRFINPNPFTGKSNARF